MPMSPSLAPNDKKLTGGRESPESETDCYKLPRLPRQSNVTHFSGAKEIGHRSTAAYFV
jgi:hypothetical protein